MKRSSGILTFILVIVFSCSDNEANKTQNEKTTDVYSEKYFGISIENGPRQGSPYFDSLGTEYFYISKKITLSNDTTVPIDLKISFSKEYDHMRVNKGLKSKVFLLPEELTSDEQQYNVTMSKELKFDLGLTKELKRFLKSNIETVSLIKTINPHEKYTVRFGVLTDLKYPLPVYFGLKLNVSSSAKRSSTMPLVLYLDNPFAIPCGQFSFPDK